MLDGPWAPAAVTAAPGPSAASPQQASLLPLPRCVSAFPLGPDRRLQAQRDAAEAARQARIRSPAHTLAECILSRGWRVGRPQFTIGDRRPVLDEDGLVHWPVLFFYPEAGMQQDSVDDVCEEDRFK